MAKRLTFEELIGKEYRWPKPGDDPFELTDHDGNHALIAPHNLTRMLQMAEGYRRSADVLIEVALDDENQKEFLVYPILFLYRHAIELQLKYIIDTYGRDLGIGSIWNSHDFAFLWPHFLTVLKHFGTDDPDIADEAVSGVIAQFGNVDPKSFSNRYPCDTRGNPIPLVRDRVSLETLKDVMEGVFAYFAGTDSYLSDLTAAAD